MLKRIVGICLVCVMTLTVLPQVSNAKEASAIDTGVVQSVTNEKVQGEVFPSTSKVKGSIDKSSYKSLKKAGKTARGQIYNHKSIVEIKVKSKESDPQKVYNSLESIIYAETSNVNKGDYMKWDVDGTATSFSRYKEGNDNYYYYTYTIYITYLTTIAQRKELDKKVAELIKGFKFTDKTSKYKKIKKVYV